MLTVLAQAASSPRTAGHFDEMVGRQRPPASAEGVLNRAPLKNALTNGCCPLPCLLPVRDAPLNVLEELVGTPGRRCAAPEPPGGLKAPTNAAVKRGYAARNPVERLDDSHRPQAVKKEAAYFEDAELPKLRAELGGLHEVLYLLALKTGMRENEKATLRWSDVDMVNSVVRVRAENAKNSKAREVFLTSDVVELLGAWWGECGRPADNVLVFSTGEGPVPYWAFTKQILYPAMKRAGIPRVGPTGEKRTWHSLRHTYARIVLEHGRSTFWLSKQLGHSSEQVTKNVYGHWSRTARRAEVEKLEGVFKF
jgi:integrase